MKRALVVGSGSIARRHLSNLRRLWPDGEIGCVSASGRQLASAEIADALLINSLSDAIAWKPDLVIVASPAPFHLGHAAEFAAQGAPVLIEKPLLDRSNAFAEVASVLEPHAARIDVAYCLRFLTSAQRFRAAVHDNLVGRIRNILIDVGQYLPDWRPQANYRIGVSARRALGGGALLELSHEFDYLRWIFGDFDRGFCSALQSGMFDINVEDRADIVLTRADGVVANLHMDFLQRRPHRTCKAIGEAGTLVWDGTANSVTLETKDRRDVLFAEPNADRNEMYLNQLRHFHAVSQGAAEPSVGLQHALETVRLVDLLKISAETGRLVELR